MDKLIRFFFISTPITLTSTISPTLTAYREENGQFTDRKELLKVAKLGPKAFEQCAGFMRISGCTLVAMYGCED